MASHWKSHVVLSGSTEHALLASTLVDTPRTRRQMLVIAVRDGLRLYDDETVGNALKRLNATGLLQVSLGSGGLRTYRLTPQGEQMLQVLAQSPA